RWLRAARDNQRSRLAPAIGLLAEWQSTRLTLSSMVPPASKWQVKNKNDVPGNAAQADRDQGLFRDARRFPAQGRRDRMGRRQPARPADRLLHRRPVLR